MPKGTLQGTLQAAWVRQASYPSCCLKRVPQAGTRDTAATAVWRPIACQSSVSEIYEGPKAPAASQEVCRALRRVVMLAVDQYRKLQSVALHASRQLENLEQDRVLHLQTGTCCCAIATACLLPATDMLMGS